MVRVGDFGSKVPQPVQEEVLKAQKAIATGKLQPFHARDSVLDNEGKRVIAKGQALTDAQILEMNYLVAGVQGKIGR
jgi:simple sugar transport system substrate-binding protein